MTITGIRDRRTLAFVLVALLCVVYLVDSYTEVSVMEDTTLPVGMEKPAPKKGYGEFVQAARGMNPLYPVGIGMASLPDLSHKLPRYFKYKETFLTPVVNQGACASCWAISVCHVVSDRISLLTGGKIMRPLSHQELVSCFNVKGDLGCEVGGSPEQAFGWGVEKGFALASDYPYEQGDTTKIAPCRARRQQGPRTFVQRGSVKSLCEDPSRYKEGSPQYLKVVKRNMLNMRTELYLHGSICITVQIYKSMYQFDGLKIYEGPEGDDEYIGGHAAVCFGYSEEVNGDEEGFDGDMWFVKNSWSSSWPIRSPSSKGIFYIRAGKNVCGIESRASCAQPVITDEMRAKAAGSIHESAYSTYGSYVADPSRNNFIKKSTRLRAALKM